MPGRNSVGFLELSWFAYAAEVFACSLLLRSRFSFWFWFVKVVASRPQSPTGRGAWDRQKV